MPRRADKTLLIRIPRDLHKVLKVRAAEKGISMAVLTERALVAYLNRRRATR
jgi:predicted HicB family RNase H-like nuclease